MLMIPAKALGWTFSLFLLLRPAKKKKEGGFDGFSSKSLYSEELHIGRVLTFN
jgi:hypothetical protein